MGEPVVVQNSIRRVKCAGRRIHRFCPCSGRTGPPRPKDPTAMASGRASGVAVVKPAEDGRFDDLSHLRRLDRPWDRAVASQAEVGPGRLEALSVGPLMLRD